MSPSKLPTNTKNKVLTSVHLKVEIRAALSQAGLHQSGLEKSEFSNKTTGQVFLNQVSCIF